MLTPAHHEGFIAISVCKLAMMDAADRDRVFVADFPVEGTLSKANVIRLGGRPAGWSGPIIRGGRSHTFDDSVSSVVNHRSLPHASQPGVGGRQRRPR